MDISCDYYKLFYYIAKYGSFSKAATVLMRSQPNITKAMNNLEHQLGCRLLVRTNRGVTLTAEGEKLYSHVGIAMEHLLSAENEIKNNHSLLNGTVSIATTEVALYGAVLNAISRFSKDFPNVKIRLTNHSNAKALQTVKNGLADFAVISTDEVDRNIFAVKQIKEFREVLCCRKDRYADILDADIQAIKDHPYISLTEDTHTFRFLREYLFGHEIYKEPEIQVETVDQILPIIKCGVGIGFVSEFIAKESIEKGEIVEIPLKSPPPMRKLCVAYEKKHSMNPAARKFTEYLIC